MSIDVSSQPFADNFLTPILLTIYDKNSRCFSNDTDFNRVEFTDKSQICSGFFYQAHVFHYEFFQLISSDIVLSLRPSKYKSNWLYYNLSQLLETAERMVPTFVFSHRFYFHERICPILKRN